MAVPFSNTHLRVPRGFGTILEGLAREVLRDQPDNIPVYAARYFENLLKRRQESGMDPAEWAAKLEDRYYNNHAFNCETSSAEQDTEPETFSKEKSYQSQTEAQSLCSSEPSTAQPIDANKAESNEGTTDEGDNKTSEKPSGSVERDFSERKSSFKGQSDEQGETLKENQPTEEKLDDCDRSFIGIDSKLCHEGNVPQLDSESSDLLPTKEIKNEARGSEDEDENPRGNTQKDERKIMFEKKAETFLNVDDISHSAIEEEERNVEGDIVQEEYTLAVKGDDNLKLNPEETDTELSPSQKDITSDNQEEDLDKAQQENDNEAVEFKVIRGESLSNIDIPLDGKELSKEDVKSTVEHKPEAQHITDDSENKLLGDPTTETLQTKTLDIQEQEDPVEKAIQSSVDQSTTVFKDHKLAVEDNDNLNPDCEESDTELSLPQYNITIDSGEVMDEAQLDKNKEGVDSKASFGERNESLSNLDIPSDGNAIPKEELKSRIDKSLGAQHITDDGENKPLTEPSEEAIQTKILNKQEQEKQVIESSLDQNISDTDEQDTSHMETVKKEIDTENEEEQTLIDYISNDVFQECTLAVEDNDHFKPNLEETVAGFSLSQNYITTDNGKVIDKAQQENNTEDATITASCRETEQSWSNPDIPLDGNALSKEDAKSSFKNNSEAQDITDDREVKLRGDPTVETLQTKMLHMEEQEESVDKGIEISFDQNISDTEVQDTSHMESVQKKLEDEVESPKTEGILNDIFQDYTLNPDHDETDAELSSSQYQIITDTKKEDLDKAQQENYTETKQTWSNLDISLDGNALSKGDVKSSFEQNPEAQHITDDDGDNKTQKDPSEEALQTKILDMQEKEKPGENVTSVDQNISDTEEQDTSLMETIEKQLETKGKVESSKIEAISNSSFQDNELDDKKNVNLSLDHEEISDDFSMPLDDITAKNQEDVDKAQQENQTEGSDFKDYFGETNESLSNLDIPLDGNTLSKEDVKTRFGHSPEAEHDTDIGENKPLEGPTVETPLEMKEQEESVEKVLETSVDQNTSDTKEQATSQMETVEKEFESDEVESLQIERMSNDICQDYTQAIADNDNVNPNLEETDAGLSPSQYDITGNNQEKDIDKAQEENIEGNADLKASHGEMNESLSKLDIPLDSYALSKEDVQSSFEHNPEPLHITDDGENQPLGDPPVDITQHTKILDMQEQEEPVDKVIETSVDQNISDTEEVTTHMETVSEELETEDQVERPQLEGISNDDDERLLGCGRFSLIDQCTAGTEADHEDEEVMGECDQNLSNNTKMQSSDPTIKEAGETDIAKRDEVDSTEHHGETQVEQNSSQLQKLSASVAKIEAEHENVEDAILQSQPEENQQSQRSFIESQPEEASGVEKIKIKDADEPKEKREGLVIEEPVSLTGFIEWTADDQKEEEERSEEDEEDTTISEGKEECSRPQEEEDIMDIPLDDPEANRAAAKIQAGFRGHMTRKKMKPEDKAEGEEVSSMGDALHSSQGVSETGRSRAVEREDTSVPEQ